MADCRSFFPQHCRVPGVILTLGIAAWAMSVISLCGAEQTETKVIFAGPVAEYEQPPPVTADAATPPDVLRWIWVEERMNVARRAAPMRVPIFLAAGECHDPAELALVRWPSKENIPCQWDDVRRGADGGVARLHLWCTTDLGAGESQRWALVRRNTAQAAPANSIEPRVSGDRLKIQAAGTTVAFFTDVAKRDPLAALELADGPLAEFSEGAGASVTWGETAGLGEPAKTESERTLAWGAGPIFAKVSMQEHRKNGSAIAQEYRIFADGSVNIIQTVKPAEGMDERPLATQEFLNGRLNAGASLTVHPQPAGIVDSLADFHHGYAVDALEQTGRPRGWLVVPGSLGGKAGRVVIDRDGQFHLQAPGNLVRGVGDARTNTVKMFWSEVTLLPAHREGDRLERAVELAASQPLVAVVERPGVTLATAIARVQDNVREMKPVGWVNETVIRSLQGKTEPFPRKKWATESDPAYWVAAAQRAATKVTGATPRPLAEDEKGRAAGALDPYHITYEATALVHWLLSSELPGPARDSAPCVCRAARPQLGHGTDGTVECADRADRRRVPDQL